MAQLRVWVLALTVDAHVLPQVVGPTVAAVEAGGGKRRHVKLSRPPYTKKMDVARMRHCAPVRDGRCMRPPHIRCASW